MSDDSRLKKFIEIASQINKENSVMSEGEFWSVIGNSGFSEQERIAIKNQAERWLEQGKSHNKYRQWNEAYTCLYKAYDCLPYRFDIALELSISEYKLFRYWDAEKHAKECTQLDPRGTYKTKLGSDELNAFDLISEIKSSKNAFYLLISSIVFTVLYFIYSYIKQNSFIVFV